MAQAGQQVVRDKARPEDLVSIGVLAKVIPRHVIDGVVEATSIHEQCQRLLPSWLVVYFVLGHALFMDQGKGRLISKVAGTLAWKGRARDSNTLFQRVSWQRLLMWIAGAVIKLVLPGQAVSPTATLFPAGPS